MADPPPRLALLLGAEGTGLSAAALAAVDRQVRIPMAPGVDSVNVATAAAIALAALYQGTIRPLTARTGPLCPIRPRLPYVVMALLSVAGRPMSGRERERRAATVIVADDEPHVVDYLCTLLEMEGFVVVGTAADADGVVQLAHRLEPDVALLDLRMPGGGLEAARLIGSLSSTTKIVIFSSAADESDLIPLLRPASTATS